MSTNSNNIQRTPKVNYITTKTPLRKQEHSLEKRLFSDDERFRLRAKSEESQSSHEELKGELLRNQQQANREEKKNKFKGRGCLLTMILITMLFVNFGNYYIYDFPQLFETSLIPKFGITTVQISAMYSFYSIPNFVFAPIGSMILNYTGLGLGSMIFTGFIFGSMILMYLGVQFVNFPLMLLGRFLFGMGGETMIICQTTMAEKWFSGKFMSLAMGLNTVMGFMGSSIAAYLGPYLFVKTRSLFVPVFLCAMSSFLSWFASFMYTILEMPNIKLIEDEKDEGIKFTLGDVKVFGKLYWLLTVTYCFASMAYFQFINFVTDFLMQRFSYKYEQAKNLVAFMPIVTCVLIPIISGTAVVVGRKGYILISSGIVSFVAYFYLERMAVTPDISVVICLAGVSLGYSLYSSVIWGSMALSVPKQGTSVAYGIATMLQNVLLTFLPLIYGYLNKKRTPSAYNDSLKLLQAFSLAAVFFAVVVTIYDLKNGRMIDLPENDDQVMESRSSVSDNFRRSVLSGSLLRGINDQKVRDTAKGSIHSGITQGLKEAEDDIN